MELMAAAQGIDLLRPLRSTEKLEKIHAQVRKKVPYFEEDAPFIESIEAITTVIATF
jgi:histidine ammonia-lyase